MLSIMTRLKSYAVFIVMGLLTLLASLVTFLYSRSRRAKEEKKIAEARWEHARKVIAEDQRIQLERDSRTEELANEIESKNTSGELSDPNRW